MIPELRVLLTLVLPPSGPLLIILSGFFLTRTKFRKTGKLMIAAGIVLIYLLSISPVSNALMKPLERGYEPFSGEARGADVIVVLTAGVKDFDGRGLNVQPDGTAHERLAAAIEIQRKTGLPLLIAGGRADPARPELSMGAAHYKKALALGAPKEKLILEEESKNTYEGALNVAKLRGKGKKVIVVTSAFHMGRSLKLFKKAGLLPVAAPAAYMGQEARISHHSFLPAAENLSVSSTALYEYISRLWYFLKDSLSSG